MTKVRSLTNFDFMACNYNALLQRYAANNLKDAFPGKVGRSVSLCLRRERAREIERERESERECVVSKSPSC